MTTIKELIEELSKYPPESKITHAYEYSGNYHPHKMTIIPSVLYKMEGEERICPKDWYFGKEIKGENEEKCFGIY